MDPKKFQYKPYENIYPELFETEKSRLKSVLDKDIKIDHFGSSAVINLGGKGIIDIYVTTNKSNINFISNELKEKLGYDYRPAGGDERRLFFRRYQKDKNGIKRTYHIHLSDFDNPDYQQAIALRDYLKSHTKDAESYNNIKRKGSELAMKSDDYEMQKQIYQNTKTKLLEKLNLKSRHWIKTK